MGQSCLLKLELQEDNVIVYTTYKCINKNSDKIIIT